MPVIDFSIKTSPHRPLLRLDSHDGEYHGRRCQQFELGAKKLRMNLDSLQVLLVGHWVGKCSGQRVCGLGGQGVEGVAGSQGRVKSLQYRNRPYGM